jgi:DNA-binding protein HU-beta
MGAGIQQERRMSKKLLADVIRESAGTTGIAATQAASDVVAQMAFVLRTEGRFTLPGFGAFVVRETAPREGCDPRTGKPLSIKAGKTVRFKVSPALKAAL